MPELVTGGAAGADTQDGAGWHPASDATRRNATLAHDRQQQANRGHEPTEVTMQQRQVSWVFRSAWPLLALLACLASALPARADTPALSIKMTGGQQAVYSLLELQRIGFEGDTLVVAKAGASDRYATADIVKIEFLMEYSAVQDPRDAAVLVKAMRLFQNQPNPFSPDTRIRFDLPKAGPVGLSIYSVNGRLIRKLVNDTRPAGRHITSWDGRNDAGDKVGSGVYFYRLIAQGAEESRRMILLP